MTETILLVFLRHSVVFCKAWIVEYLHKSLYICCCWKCSKYSVIYCFILSIKGVWDVNSPAGAAGWLARRCFPCDVRRRWVTFTSTASRRWRVQVFRLKNLPDCQVFTHSLGHRKLHSHALHWNWLGDSWGCKNVASKKLAKSQQTSSKIKKILAFGILSYCLHHSLQCCKPGPTFSKLLRKILGRFIILGKS